MNDLYDFDMIHTYEHERKEDTDHYKMEWFFFFFIILLILVWFGALLHYTSLYLFDEL